MEDFEYMSENKKNGGHTVLVFPANGALGYEVCCELVSGENKDTMHEVLAICNNKQDHFVDKLKGLGKRVRVICIEMPMHEEAWRKQLKGETCDCMMLVTAPNAHHMRGRMGDSSEMQRGSPQMLVRSFEACLSMAPHMKCDHLVIATGFRADDRKYRLWNYIYSNVERMAMKHFDGKNCMVLFHNMVYEVLLFHREEIQQRKMLSWPVSGQSEACAMSLRDLAMCCCGGIMELLGEERGSPGDGDDRDERKKRRKMHMMKVTGRDKLSPENMIQMMGNSFNVQIQYHEVRAQQYKAMLMRKRMFTPLQIQAILEMFQMMEDGRLAKCTSDADDLMGEKPEHFEKWLGNHGDDFAPKRAFWSRL